MLQLSAVDEEPRTCCAPNVAMRSQSSGLSGFRMAFVFLVSDRSGANRAPTKLDFLHEASRLAADVAQSRALKILGRLTLTGASPVKS